VTWRTDQDDREGEEAHLEFTEGGKHQHVRPGDLRTTIPRSTEINEMTAGPHRRPGSQPKRAAAARGNQPKQASAASAAPRATATAAAPAAASHSRHAVR
jgi:hypothetical protein